MVQFRRLDLTPQEIDELFGSHAGTVNEFGEVLRDYMPGDIMDVTLEPNDNIVALKRYITQAARPQGKATKYSTTDGHLFVKLSVWDTAPKKRGRPRKNVDGAGAGEQPVVNTPAPAHAKGGRQAQANGQANAAMSLGEKIAAGVR